MPVIFIQIHIGIRVDKGIIDVKTKMIVDGQQDIQSATIASSFRLSDDQGVVG